VRYDATGVTVRTGWSRAAEPLAASSQISGAPAATPVEDRRWREELAATERRLRAELARQTNADSGARTATAGPTVDQDELLRRMRALVAESEQRQQRELALRFAQLVQDVDSQRRADLVQIEQNLGQIEGLTAAQQREMMQYLVRVSEGR